MVADMHAWLVHHRARIAVNVTNREALAYIANHWGSLRLFLSDGRIENDNNTVERI